MEENEFKALKSQLKVLKDVSNCYSGKTIDNVIQQIQSRVNAIVNSSYKLKVQDLVGKKLERLEGETYSNPMYAVLLHLTDFLNHAHSDDVVLAKLRMMEKDGFPSHALIYGPHNKPNPDKPELDELAKMVAKECIDYLKLK